MKKTIEITEKQAELIIEALKIHSDLSEGFNDRAADNKQKRIWNIIQKIENAPLK